MKKILFIVQLPPPVHGASLMNNYVNNSEVLKSNFKIRTLPLRFISKIKDIGKFSFSKIWLVIVFVFKLLIELIFHRPKLVYYTLAPVGGAFYRDALFVFIIKLFRVNILFHMHGKGIEGNSKKSIIVKYVYKLVFKNVDVIHLGDSLIYDIQDVFEGIPYIVPNGMEIKNSGTQSGNIELVRFIYLSNLDKTKGIELFLKSLVTLHNEGYNFEARIIGNSTMNFTIEDAKKIVEDNGLNHKVKILGPLYGEEKYKELAEASIFVLPTFYKNECFPLSIIEAMQFRNAVISSCEGAIPEMIENDINGFVVEELNCENLVKKLSYCLEHRKEVEDMALNNYNKFTQKYTLNIFENNLLNVFRSVLKKNEAN